MSNTRDRPHVFIDESKGRQYLIIAAVVPGKDLEAARRCVRSLRHRGSPSIHMVKESDRSRKRIIDGFKDFGFRASVVIATDGTELERRMSCLATVFRMSAASNASHLVIERDESVLAHDRRLFVAETLRIGSIPFEYAWCPRNDDELLWVSDAAAWCYARGGSWKARIEPLLSDQRPAIRI